MLAPPLPGGLEPLVTGYGLQRRIAKGCSHGTIATANCLSQLMDCVTFSVIVAILPAEGSLGGVYDVACNICYVCDVAIAQYEWTLNEVDFPLILFV